MQENTFTQSVFPNKASLLIGASLLLLLATGCGGGGVFTVNSSADGNDTSPGDGYCRAGSSLTECTLRAAMEEADALAGIQTIHFNLPADDTYIYPLSPLPLISDEVIIDGTSQPGFDGGKPIVHVDGSSMPAATPVSGFWIMDDIHATIQGLQILRFPGHGIENYGNLTLDHLEIALNQVNGIDSFKNSGTLDISLSNSTIFENAGTGISGINADFHMDYVSAERNTGGGIRAIGGEFVLDHGTIADNAVPTRGGGLYLSMTVNPEVRNTTIEGNTAGHEGGGLYWWGLPGMMMMVNNCTFDGNYGYDGGGIYIDAGTSHLAASTLINNRAKHSGGGVFVNVNNNPTLWVEDGTVIGRPGEGNIANSAPASGGLGGGIYNMKDLNIANSTIEGNTGDGIYNEGGSIRIQDSSASENTLSGIESFISGATVDILVNRSRFEHNGASGIGAINADLTVTQGSIRNNMAGGIRMNGGSLMMDKSEVTGNESAGEGGGIALYNAGLSAIENSTISNNTAAASGGGIYFWGLGAGGDLKLNNTTISGNRAVTTGGGFEAASGVIGVNNVTLARNTAAAAGGLHSAATVHVLNTLLAENTGGNCGGAIVSFGNNLDDAAACAFSEPGDLSGPAILGPLADNGGGTFTHALLPGSPALEAGNDLSCRPTDQRGIIRPQGLHCDIGAFESETPITATPPAVTSTLTPTPTGTPTTTGAPIVFNPVELSTGDLFQGAQSCDPESITIRVRVTPPALVSSVGLFYRVVAKQGNQNYPWGGGLAMIPQGSGWYALTVAGNDFPNIGTWKTEAWLDFQFVANNANNQPIAWSAVIRKVTLWQCYV